ncbi:F-box only protein 7 [Gastrophryne carolinensis]
MKLRIRVRDRTGSLELEGKNTTLRELRAKLSATFLPTLGYSSDAAFEISLNGKDPLTEDEKTLGSYDIISGDLVYLLMPALQPAPAAPVTVPQPIPDQLSATTNAPQSNLACKSQNPQIEEQGKQDLPEPGPSSCAETICSAEAAMEDETSDFLSEPMLVCESVEERIPHSLEALYLSAGCTTANDALMVVIHLLMAETGYIVQGIAEKGASMPEDWRRCSDGLYKLYYSHPLGGESTAVLACVPMGRLLIVNVTLTVNQEVRCVKKLQLPTHSYINYPGQENNVSSVFGDLRKLSRVVKDQLIYPLLAATRQALELPDVFGLLVLPPELKLRIFRLLDVKSLLTLASTCKELHADTQDPTLWKFLCKRDFRGGFRGMLEMDWKRHYMLMYKKRHLHRRRLRDLEAFQPPIFQPNPLILQPFHPEFPFPPGIIGGDYDQRPVLPIRGDPLALIIPGRQPPMDPFQPARPHLPAVSS